MYKKILDRIAASNWGAQIHEFKTLPGKIYFNPDDAILKKFGNRFVHYEGSIMISSANTEQIGLQLKVAKALCDESTIEWSTESLEPLSGVNLLNNIDAIIEQFFSPKFCSENSLNKGTLEEIITGSHASEIVTEEDEYSAIRYEEYFHDHKVILAVSKITGNYWFEIHFIFTSENRIEDLLSNPVTSFFEDVYQYSKYERALKKHALYFLEKQGAKMYPYNLYNDQIFKIKFNVNNIEGIDIDIITTSGRIQKKMVNKLAKYLFVLFGKDINNKGFAQLAEDMVAVDGTPISYYRGFRLYSLPLYDIEFVFTEELENDDYGNEFLALGLIVKLKPFGKDKDDAGSWCLHPMVYDWEK